ncbi:MAG TPA: hypothetical protein DEG17_27370 [Cyanobacteria bacterium UBA11149]|nr:hypothetical protein [Cyanobacteria bacterium UBA11367]HBE57601.1 hypothetical protein [Cyanobacteria bacterium UBA11366]HBK63063.1 hypothetical protein [Cyanobacteria bacterium UBA11166]HBR77047.1 hypothetical protein [Cyanobacteria bacterium UBA11159]HBS71990.1 hypothetical protein [Cyanobacteria bacterium UBA11153]HBW92482.1 hypothetical protein [Cyanobacteria bacterium UBA11149]HCA96433.1 hypothetical protein [Cyanobacteria bacterium UBA9226]
MPALDPSKLGSKARFWFKPDAVSAELQIKNCKNLKIELTTSQTKGSVGSSQGSKAYTESAPTGEKVDNDLEMTLTPTSVESLRSLMEWIDKYQNSAYTGGASQEVASTTGVITICNRAGSPILEYDLVGLIPISCSSPTYKAEDIGDLDYNVKCRYVELRKPKPQ